MLLIDVKIVYSPFCALVGTARGRTSGIGIAKFHEQNSLFSSKYNLRGIKLFDPNFLCAYGKCIDLLNDILMRYGCIIRQKL